MGGGGGGQGGGAGGGGGLLLAQGPLPLPQLVLRAGMGGGEGLLHDCQIQGNFLLGKVRPIL